MSRDQVRHTLEWGPGNQPESVKPARFLALSRLTASDDALLVGEGNLVSVYWLTCVGLVQAPVRTSRCLN